LRNVYGAGSDVACQMAFHYEQFFIFYLFSGELAKKSLNKKFSIIICRFLTNHRQTAQRCSINLFLCCSRVAW
jgi:hypothetical protein